MRVGHNGDHMERSVGGIELSLGSIRRVALDVQNGDYVEVRPDGAGGGTTWRCGPSRLHRLHEDWPA